MNAYADSGFLVSLYTRDSNSSAALVRMQTQPLPLPWCWLHEVEFKNAVRLKAFRKEIDTHEVPHLLSRLADDIKAGVYARTSSLTAGVFDEAERLIATFSIRFGTRSLDILHVAHALVLGSREFLTFDRRQAALAEAAGLQVPQL